MLNVARLRVLKEVAYRGSFSAAADALSYTQSAVSQQIATLEAETGMTLLERHPRGVSLTAAGQTLVGHAEGILARAGGRRGGAVGDRGPARRAAAHGLVPDRRRDADAARDRELPRRLPRRRADARRGRAGGDRRRACAPASSTSRCCSSSPARRRWQRGHDARGAARGPDVPRAAARAPARGARRLRLADLARRGVGADLAREPLRAPRRAQLPRRRLRAAAWRSRATTTRPSRASSPRASASR